jgi:hypothetical protein
VKKPAIARVAEGAHRAPVTSARFTATGAAPTAITVDATGVVNFLTFSKMLGLRWGVEVTCVLDGSRTGPVVSLAALLPPPPPPPTTTAGAGGGGGGAASGGGDGSSASGSFLTSAFSTGGAAPSGGAGGAAPGGAAAAAAAAGAAAASGTAALLPGGGSLVALSTRDATYILATAPQVSVIHRWARPDGAPAGAVPSLAWGVARV